MIEYEGKRPQVHDTVFLAETAVLIGDVVVGPDSSVWFGAVLRGDAGEIRIGGKTNIQDNVVIHADTENGTHIGDCVTVGHGAVLHDTRVGNRCLVGMNATLLHYSVVEDECMIGAGCVIRERFEAPRRSVVAGVPGKIMKEIDDSATRWLDEAYQDYLYLVERYGATAKRLD
jgi:carbonic anhydrase/acetyltransferase-like protein (isoleucine patch superfamily)